MRHNTTSLHYKKNFFFFHIMKQKSRENRNPIQSKMMRIMLLLVLALLIIVSIGCTQIPLDCKDVQVQLEPGECWDDLIHFWIIGDTWPEDAPSNVMCDGRGLTDISSSKWYFSPPLGIYKKGNNICATENVPAYSSPVIVPYELYNVDASEGVFGEVPYFGSARFFITSTGSGPLSVTASAEYDDIPFGITTRLYAAIGGGTGPDFTFSWEPEDSLISPNAQNPLASPTVTTEYTVTVTDSEGAVVTGNVTVTVSLGVFVSASPDTINIGQSSTLNVTAGGGTPPYTYTYETTDGDILATDITDPFLSVSPSQTATYVVTATDFTGQTATGNATVTVRPAPGFQVIKYSIPDTLRAGDAFQYQIIVRNEGLGTATGVILRDPLPPEITLNLPLPFGCMGIDNEVFCSLNDLTYGEQAEVTIDAMVNSGVSGPIVNTVFVTSNETGETSDTWSSNVCPETVANCFDLSIVKTATTLVSIGDNVRYGLSVANLGPDEATGVIITDHLPPGFEFAPVNSTSACSAVCSTVTCSLGNYPPGFSELVIIEATVTPQASAGTNVNTAIVVSSVEQDPVPGNNSDNASTNVVIIPSDLEITVIAADPPAIDPGDPSQLTIIVEGGNEPYSFLWTADPQSGNPSDGGIASGDETLQNPSVTPLSPTEYTVVVTDASGKTASASVRVSIGFTVWADADPADIIFGDSSQLFATVVGGVVPYTYSWGGPWLNFYDIVNPIAVPEDDTEYQIYVFDDIGNFAFDSVTVSVAMIVTVMAFPDVINSGGWAELVVTPVQGGAYPYTYEWTPANGLDPADSNNWNPMVSPSVSTTYEMTVTDMNGKVGTGCVHVQVNPP